MDWKKLIVAAMMVLLATMMLIGCGEKPAAAETSLASVSVEEESATEPAETPEQTEPEESEEPAAPPAPSAAQPVVDAGAMSENWWDGQILFDGVVYTLPLAYSTLAEAGWTFNLADYGYEDGYVMNKGDKTYSTIKLTNTNYDEKLDVTVGFINSGDAAADITECNIWSLSCNTRHGFDPVASYPSMQLAKGITWGSTEEQVIAAYGKPNEVYDSERGYKVLSYTSDNGSYLDLDVYAEGGVSKFDYSNYN